MIAVVLPFSVPFFHHLITRLINFTKADTHLRVFNKISQLSHIAASALILTLLFTGFTATEAIAQVDPPTSGNLTNPLQNRPQTYTISEIIVTGAETRSDGMIIATSGLEEGSQVTIPGPDIGEAIKRLHRTGLFSDVQIFQLNQSGRQIELEIQVLEQPRLDSFEITGTKRSQRRDLRDLIPLIPGFAVTDASRAQAERAIIRYFRDEGYRNTEVEIIEKDFDAIRNRVTLEFKVDRGDRLEIEEIVFEGNESFEDSDLRGELKEIKRDNFWRFLTRQTFDQASYEEAQDNLISFYQKNGFRDMRIVDDSVYVYNYKSDKEGIGVYMKIAEGPQYRIRNIEFDGNTVYEEEELIAALNFEKGDVYNQEKFDRNFYGNERNDDVFSMYHDIGYVFLREETEVSNVPGDSVDIYIQLAEDEVATIRQVEFMGNTKTHDHVVRRNLRNIPGSNYSRAAIRRSIRELSTLGYFVPENLDVSLDPDYEEKTVDLYYTVDESAGADNFELSGGFGGRQFGVILSARVNFNNFSAGNLFNGSAWRPLPSGDGQKLSLGVQLTGRGYRSFNFGFQEPWMFGRPNSFSFNTSYSFFEFSGRTQNERYEQFRSSVALGRRLQWPDDLFTQTTRVQFQLFDTAFPRGLIEPGRSTTLSVRFGLSRNSLDNFISPNSGSTFDIGFETAVPLPGLDQFYQFDTGFTQHVPIIGDLVATTGFEYGYLGWYSDKNRSQYQRYYLGGTQLQQQQTFYQNNIDLRGFPGGRNGSISPYNSGDPIGGRIYSKYASEIRYPAVRSEQLQFIPYLFAEAGNSYRDFNDFDPFRVKRSVGLGSRIFLPILGLIDISYGYRLDGVPGTPVQAGEWEFLFNIGSPF